MLEVFLSLKQIGGGLQKCMLLACQERGISEWAVPFPVAGRSVHDCTNTGCFCFWFVCSCFHTCMSPFTHSSSPPYPSLLSHTTTISFTAFSIMILSLPKFSFLLFFSPNLHSASSFALFLLYSKYHIHHLSSCVLVFHLHLCQVCDILISLHRFSVSLFLPL